MTNTESKILWLSPISHRGNDLTSDLCLTIASELDDLLLPYTIDLSIFADLNNAKLREHIERVGVVFFEREMPRN